MKSTLIMAIGMLFAFVGCQTKAQDLRIQQKESKMNTENYDIQIKYPIFSAIDAEVNKSCLIFNGKIEEFVNNLKDKLQSDATKLFQTFVDKPDERPVWKYELIINDSVFMATEQFISVRLSVYTFIGGAHGNATVHSLNYDVKNQKFLKNEDILNYTNGDQITSKIKACFENPEGCFTKEPTLDLVNAINFDATSVCFMYEQYVLGAYSCGAAEITVPRKVLQENILIKLD